ncbi:hypothetical protein UNSWDHB_370 [Dehalobacter sp. UNSWDHB]|jgi:hypothetical protein|uniref:hypothetical protein n=1 Tax=unclassified Dehalobacter TaxID=2635733 RepID=UPI00028B684E|nr:MULTISPECIES: hypothetical protein [unclassified Dehalobacter]AFV02436.1 hypothetical protein DHBDCA_p1407 [Dehalobacter sp. DCA]AFV05425.1 hypothetical protein DCF50_p1419 [Dehalobacter sp. CF]EQB22345.1 hypothetical protein UNSWDHB_370 [Dehalobacter sp. UNSWDHB]
MEQNVRPFEKFLPGSHLILGEAGSGKTRLIWSILQGKDFVEDHSINIVLTDSEKRIWYNPPNNPVHTINPYETDISWVTEPTKPGIYYCACDYAPRIITFLECLATWSIHEKNIINRVRIFIDLPSKYWNIPEFAEQLGRLDYITANRKEEDGSLIEIWAAIGSLNKISSEIKSLFQHVNLIMLNPLPNGWSNKLLNLLDIKCDNLPEIVAGINSDIKDGFYYIPITEEYLALDPKPIVKP